MKTNILFFQCGLVFLTKTVIFIYISIYIFKFCILQKLIVCPVLHNMTKPKSNADTNKGVEDNLN